MEYFLNNNNLKEIIDTDKYLIEKNITLGDSVIDFKIGDTDIEVKTPLGVVEVKYNKKIKTRPKSPII